MSATNQPQNQSLPLTYAAAGVDVAAGDRAVELMKKWVARTHRPEVVGGIGGFAGLFDASALKNFRRPLLATSTNGVGTKVQIAQRMNIHHTIGFDLVGMVVDDIVVAGAEPLFMTDYIACGAVHPERIADIVAGIAQACVVAGCALTGGETAEHPGLLGPDEYDIAGAVTGVVEADQVLGAHLVQPGDVIVGIAASGLHSNGFSLVRAVIERANWGLEREVPEFGRTLGEELLEPTRIYAQAMLKLIREVEVHALSHITGGGLAANIARVIPAGLLARIDRGSWQPAAVFGVIARLGGVPRADLEQTLNLGVGMVAIVPQERAADALRNLSEQGLGCWILGEVSTLDATQIGSSEELIQGVKGVDGGAVLLHGAQDLA